MNEIWPKVRLGDVCKITAGNSAPQDKALFQGGKYPFIRTSDVGEIHFGVIENSRDKLNDVGIRGLRLFPKGSILFPKSGASTYLNHRVLLGVDAYVVSHLAVIMPSEKVYPEFLLHALSLVDAKSLMQDNSYPSLRADEIGAAEIPLPPLAEQKKIVEKVEKALKRVDALKAQFERMEKSAADYFKAALAETFAAVKGEKVKLGDVCESISVRGHQIKQSEIGQYGAYPVISQSENEIEGYTDQAILVKDIPLVLFGDHTCVVKKIDFPFVVGADGTKLLKPLKHDVSYFYYFCTWAASKLIDGRYRRHYSDMAECMMPKIDMADQISAVQRLDAAKSKSERMVAAARRGIAICGKMRKAILAEAFQ